MSLPLFSACGRRVSLCFQLQLFRSVKKGFSRLFIFRVWSSIHLGCLCGRSLNIKEKLQRISKNDLPTRLAMTVLLMPTGLIRGFRFWKIIAGKSGEIASSIEIESPKNDVEGGAFGVSISTCKASAYRSFLVFSPQLQGSWALTSSLTSAAAGVGLPGKGKGLNSG